MLNVRERPILFSAPMVRAILDGSKTQTRRVVKPTQSKPKVAPLRMEPWIIDGEQETDDNGSPLWAGFHPDYPGEAKWFSCPYGKSGDRLWVRETWSESYIDGRNTTIYRADLPNVDNFLGWKPSIHMPRWASRITLEVTGVRVERVQEISDEDCIAEGMEPLFEPYKVGRSWLDHPRPAFCALWEDINGKRGYGWDANPWVWCIAFRRITS